MEKDEQHKLDTKKLTKLETELVNLITETNNDPLAYKFLEWQNQRIKCNVGFMSILESKLK